MKNITLSAKEESIEQARQLAKTKGTTLNEMFREWLQKLDDESGQNSQAALNKLWQRTSYARAGKKFSREEMNER